MIKYYYFFHVTVSQVIDMSYGDFLKEKKNLVMTNKKMRLSKKDYQCYSKVY